MQDENQSSDEEHIGLDPLHGTAILMAAKYNKRPIPSQEFIQEQGKDSY